MSVTNPAPVAISGDTWSVEGGIRSFTVNIPAEPVDNDLAGVIIIASTTGDPEYDAEGSDVFYKGPWQEYITVATDASNAKLLPNQIYRVGIAAYDQFGSAVANVDFGSVFKDVVTFQLATADIADDAVDTDQVADEAITDAKIASLTADKIDAGTITGSTLRTAASGQRFEVSSLGNEAHFYGDRGDGVVEDLCTIGINVLESDHTVLVVGNASMSKRAAYFYSGAPGFETVRIRSDGGGYGMTVLQTGTGAEYASSFSYTGHLDDQSSVYIANVNYGVHSSTIGDTVAGRFETQSGNFSSSNTVEIVENRTLSSGAALYVDVTGSGSTSSAIEVNNGDIDHNGGDLRVSSGNSDLSGGTIYSKSYTVATLPSASPAAGMIYVSDETGGAVMAFSDGTNWRRVTDRAVVA